MTKREWLSRAYKLESCIQELKTAYSNAYDTALYISPAFSLKVQTGQENGSETKLSKCVDLLSQIEKLIEKQYAIKQEITTAICAIEDNRYKAVLIARYINFKKICQISKEQGYDERHIKRLINEGSEAVKIQLH